MRIAIQGIKGSFHDIAARRYFGSDECAQIELLECMTFKQVFEAVENSDADFGMVAIENTIAGSIAGNYRLLESHALSIVGEVYLRIQHYLVAIPGQRIEDITRVLGHPVAIPQCEKFFQERPWIQVQEASDTASSAKLISETKLHGTAAIAGFAAAEMYGL